MVVPSRRIAGFLLLGIAALAVVALVPQDVDAGEYWVVGLPDTGGSVCSVACTPGPPVSVSTTVAVSNIGAALDTVTLNKVSAGVTTVAATFPVSPATTGTMQFTDYLQGSQISNSGVYFVGTVQPAEVHQLTAAGAGLAPGMNGGGVAASHALETSQLGKSYTVFTAALDESNEGVYYPPNPNYFTVIATKDNTDVTVTPTVKTAASAGCPSAAGPCAAPDQVPAMNAMVSYTYTLNRGQALHVESGNLGNPDCIPAFVPWFILGGSGAACFTYDLTGTQVTATTAVAVFAGTGCWSNGDGGNCNIINEQMKPDTAAGFVYVICAGPMNGATPTSGTSLMDFIRLKAVGSGVTGTLTFAQPVSATYGSGGITTAMVSSTSWSQYYVNKDTVITSDVPLVVYDYLDVNNDNLGAGGNPVTTAQFQLYTWGAPGHVAVTPIDRALVDHWMYGFPGFENHVIIGAPLGTTILDNGVALPPALTRAIPGSSYGCTSPIDNSTTGGLHRVLTSAPASVQMIGLGPITGYWYDSGGTPAPPPVPPVASFKWTPVTTACGPHPVTFTDASVKGDYPIVTWYWTFGDGTTSNDQNPGPHTYATPGEYTVTETVTDSSGASSMTTIQVFATAGDPCLEPTISEDNSFAPRPPHDGVDESVADSDADKDGIANAVDNCVFTANADQSDIDVDDSGDLCDTDMDNDGVLNAGDNCVDISNGSQLDQNGDGEGDLCDVDVDGDGVLNLKDNCATAPNADQADTDSNLRGDACDMLLFEAGAAPEASRPMTEEKGALATQELASTPWLAYLVAIIAAMALVALLLVVVGRRK